MHRFRLWAPNASEVEVVLADRALRMQPRDSGWYELDVDDAGPGDDYSFRLDGGPPRPDPRSGWQPDGVEGPSRIVDHSAFGWSDGGWHGRPLAGSVIYELHVGTFTSEGTFDAAVDRLDHFVDLGVTTVELMPVADFPGRWGWGYDGVALYAPRQAYGGPDGLKRLVDACHQRGLAVVLDVVYNHLGPSGNFLAEFGPYFTDHYRTPWGSAVNLDGADSDEVRAFFVDNALMWLRDYHLDGLRLDAVHAIVDTSAVHLVEEIAARVADLSAQLGRQLAVIAESDLNDPRVVRPRDVGGYGATAQWSDDFHHALHAVLTRERGGYYSDFGRVEQLAHALRHAFVYEGQHAPHRRRRHGRPTSGLTGNSFLGYLQNHDQVGNRAVGERISHLVSLPLAKVGAALVLTAPFVPMLFQGEEWAASTPFQYFTDHADRALGEAVSEGRRNEFRSFGWEPDAVPDPQDPATYERSKLDWNEVEKPEHAEMLDWVRALVRLRQSTPALLDGRLDLVGVRFDEDGRWLVMHRGPVTVAANFASAPLSLPLGHDRPSRLLLASDVGVAAEQGWVTLPSESVAILGG